MRRRLAQVQGRVGSDPWNSVIGFFVLTIYVYTYMAEVCQAFFRHIGRRGLNRQISKDMSIVFIEGKPEATITSCLPTIHHETGVVREMAMFQLLTWTHTLGGGTMPLIRWYTTIWP